VRVLQPRGGRDLALEPFARHASREVGREDLEDDLPVEGRLGGEEDPRHPAAAELPLDAIGLAQRLLELCAQRVHAGA
jgi:hypothetical protein